ncbi:MAG: hypothetical protein J7K01_02360 [Thermovirga sp.]|nr:hypothetical protein [Thermovirga sp.]
MGEIDTLNFPLGATIRSNTVLGLKDQIKLFSLCTSCNSLLVPVTKEKIVDQIEPLTRIMYNEFTQCPKCGKVFWRGSHHQHILEKLQNIMTIK